LHQISAVSLQLGDKFEVGSFSSKNFWLSRGRKKFAGIYPGGR
jgi:hypothetical protein